MEVQNSAKKNAQISIHPKPSRESKEGKYYAKRRLQAVAINKSYKKLYLNRKLMDY